MKNFIKPLAASIAISVAAAGCSTTPSYQSDYEEIKAQYNTLASNPMYESQVPVEWDKAAESYNKLQDMVEGGADSTDVQQQLYLTERKLNLVEEGYLTKSSKQEIETAERRRNDIMLSAKDRQLEQTRQEAMTAKMAAAAYAEQAKAAQEKLNSMESKAQELENEVEELSTKMTDRGLILTLSDILFPFDKAQLKPGYDSTIQKLADFLDEYPDRSIVIEGHTDSVGSDQYNMNLSSRRAESVKDSLVKAGVRSNRLSTEGLGEDKPVASNNTEAGRQQNRRVEIVIAHPKGSKKSS